MILYHGSDKAIKKPSVPLSELGREFGIGFYAVADLDLAAQQAARKVKQAFFHDNPKPTVSAFRFTLADATELRVKQLNGYDEEWLDFLMQCYTDIHFVHPYDIVIGNAVLPQVNEVLQDYRRKRLSKQDTLAQLALLPQVTQVCFATVAALEYLHPFDK